MNSHVMHTVRHAMLSFMAQYRRRVLIGLFMSVAGTLLSFVFPAITRWFVDDIIPNRRSELIVVAVLVTVAAFALRQMFWGLRILANNAFELQMTFDLRSRLHDRIQRLPLKWFDTQSPGDILIRMGDDVPAAQRMVVDLVDQGVPAVLQALVCIALMLHLQWQLALMLLLPLPFVIAGGWFYLRWVSPRALETRQAAGGLSAVFHDNIGGIRQIKSFTGEALKQISFEKSGVSYQRHSTRLARAWAWYGPTMGFCADISVVLLLGHGSWLALHDRLTLGELTQFLLLLSLLYEPVGRLHTINQNVVQGSAAARRVFEILRIGEVEDLKSGVPMKEVKGHIRFEDVSFRYDETRPTVSQVNVEVLPLETVAFVGATGSGKSTLFQLLTRFYDPDSGVITLDGIPLTSISKADLREAIGYVTQESYLFNETIRGNLLLADQTATDEALWQALEMACAAEFVRRMPGGLDAPVGDRGSRLSGGERQRIAIARAFLKDPPILLLDEATSAVDNQSEQLIQQSLTKLRANRTCLVIAHRLSTIKNASRIYVMRHGEVLAGGTHEDLMASCAYYAELVRLGTN